VQLPLLFFVCVLVLTPIIPCACAGEPAESALNLISGEPGTGLSVPPSVDLYPSLHIPGGISSNVITGSSEDYSGIVPVFPARQPAERVAPRATGTAADPFSVIDTELPPAEASALKARIQETLHAFSYDETTGSWYAHNAANQITFSYTTENGTATFSGPGTGPALSLTLAGLGRDETYTPARRGVATASGRELNITRPGYTEWYRNNDDGVEQGMTISSRPPGTGPLQVLFGLAGNATRSGTDGMTLTISGTPGESPLTYTGLHAVSADGTELPVSLTTDGTSLTWVVDDTNAVYPVTIDPVISASAADAQFTGGANSDGLGYSVALSSDGTTALVGAAYNDTAGTDAGAAYIFEKGGGWTSRSASAADAQFTGGAGSDSFGWSVALSSDGSTALVGAVGNDTAGSGAGAAYIFVKPGGGWSSRSASAADAWFTGGALGDDFGTAVSLSSDGSTALVGADYNDTGASDAGAVYIFEKGGGWSSRSASAADARFTGGAADDNLGWSAALSSDGSTVLAGAPYNNTAGSDAGAAYIFVKPGGGWSSRSVSAADARFTGGAANDDLGYSVSLSSDGSTVLVGAHGNDTFSPNAGAAYIFIKPGGGWSSRSASAADARFTGEITNDYFGYSVALSSDGSTALVGAYRNDTAGSDAGAASLFKKGGGWSSKTASAADSWFTGGSGGDEFGYSVALTSDGTTSLVGAWVNGTAGSGAGAAYIFLTAAAPTVTGISPASGTTAGGTSVTVTGTGFTGATAVKFGTTNAASYTVNSATQITAVSPAGSAGIVDITVTTSAGTSATGAADRFTYSSPTPTPTPTPAPADNGGSDSSSVPSQSGNSGSGVSIADSAPAGSSVSYSFGGASTSSPLSIRSVTIVPNKAIGTSECIVTREGPSAAFAVPDKPAAYESIEIVWVNPNDIASGTIAFSVMGSWLREHSIDPMDVVFMRQHDYIWYELPTTFDHQQDDFYYYTAITPGFSSFAVSVNRTHNISSNEAVQADLTETQTETPTNAPTITTAPTSIVQKKTATRTTVPASPATTPSTGIPVQVWGIALVVTGILALSGAAWYILRWWRRRQNPGLFEEY
jgi:PGF-pre-PGF domain-containing protein